MARKIPAYLGVALLGLMVAPGPARAADSQRYGLFSEPQGAAYGPNCDGNGYDVGPWLLPNSTAAIHFVGVSTDVTNTATEIRFQIRDGNQQVVADKDFTVTANHQEFVYNLGDNGQRVNGGLFLWVVCVPHTSPYPHYNVAAEVYFTTP